MKRFGLHMLLAAIAAVLLAGCTASPEARRDKFLAKGKAFLEKRDYARAIVEFKNAGQVMPKDADVYYHIGVAAAGMGDLNTAVVALRRSLDLNPKHAEARLRIAQLMTAGDAALTGQAEKEVKSLISESASPTADMLYTLAFTELRLGKTEAAAEILQRMLSGAPKALMPSVLLAQTKLSQKDTAGAEAVLRAAVAADPAAVPPKVILGRFYESQKKIVEAEQQYRQALAADAKSALALMDLARLQMTLGRKQEAEEQFKRLAALPDKRYRAIYGLFLFDEGRRDEAVRIFEDLAREDAADRGARTRLVAAYRATGRSAEAEKLLSKALEKNGKDLDALVQRAELSLASSKFADAETDLNRVLALRPNSAEAHYLLAKLQQARGADLRYRQELTEALRLDPARLPVRLELAGSLVASNNGRAALDVLDAAPAPEQGTLPVITFRNWAYWSLGNMKELRKGIDQGLAVQRTPDLLLQDGLLKLRTGSVAAARASLEEALAGKPGNLRALRALAQSYQQSQPLALQKVREYAARQPDSAPVQHFYGAMLLHNKDRAGAREALLLARKADPGFMPAEYALAQVDLLDGKWSDAATRLDRIVKKEPANAAARLWLANIEAARGNRDAALDHYKSVVAQDSSNAQALNNYAYLLAEHTSQTDLALKYAQKAQELVPDNLEFSDTLGWILYQKGLYSPALRYLERAGARDGNPVWKYHLAMAYARAGQRERSVVTLQAALKQNPNVPEAKLARELVNPR